MFFSCSMTVESSDIGKITGLFSNSEQEHYRSDSLELSVVSSEAASQYFDCCTSPEVIEYRGQYVCKNCAVVSEPILRDSYVSDSLNNIIHTERKNNYPYQDHGCRTVFLLENLSPKSKNLFYRLSRLNKFFNNSTEANLKSANQFLFKIASQLEIPPTIYRSALYTYKKVIDARLTVGRSIKNLMLASLYIACKQNNFCCDLDIFSKKSQIPEKTIRKNYRLILRTLGIQVKQHNSDYYLKNFCIELGLSVHFQNFAIKLMEKLYSIDPNLKTNPKGLTIAVIYFISKKLVVEKRIKQKVLSKISKISEVTIRKYMKVIQTNFDPKEYSIAAENHLEEI